MKNYYVGWDVGAWHCDKNTNSMDAIAVLNEEGEEVVETKRKVVRCELNENSISSFLNKYFGCKNFFKEGDNFIFAIDAVFRLPIGVQDIPISCVPENYYANNFLFRKTEQVVREKTGKQCLSMIQHQIGSQATKVMFFLKKYNLKQAETGIWKTSDEKVIAVETYPSALGKKGTDKEDAKLCANLAYAFSTQYTTLYSPQDYIEECKNKIEQLIKKEGWIWIPKSNFKKVN